MEQIWDLVDGKSYSTLSTTIGSDRIIPLAHCFFFDVLGYKLFICGKSYCICSMGLMSDVERRQKAYGSYPYNSEGALRFNLHVDTKPAGINAPHGVYLTNAF
jgi:hypothetical protein